MYLPQDLTGVHICATSNGRHYEGVVVRDWSVDGEYIRGVASRHLRIATDDDVIDIWPGDVTAICGTPSDG